MLAGGSPLSGAGAAAEAEKRLLGMSHQMLAHAAQQSWPAPDDSSAKSSLSAEAFAWDQVRSWGLLETCFMPLGVQHTPDTNLVLDWDCSACNR